jgi:protein O-mannosyl-transferase
MSSGDSLEHKAVERPAERPAGPDSRGAVAGMGVLLAVAVFLVFGQTIRHEFVNYDDDQYFYANPQVQHGLTWGGMAWAFQATDAANWHPLTWLSLMLDVDLLGTDPMGPHLTNALLHAINTMLLFLLLRCLTGAYWRSALVAALFGLHPLHVESVAWVSERKDVLSGLFFLLTLLCYARWVQGVTSDQPSPRFGTAGKWQVSRPETARTSLLSPVTCHLSPYYWLAVFFFALGLMSKPMLVTLPFVLLLLDYWSLGRVTSDTWRVTRFRIPVPQLSSLNHLLLEKLPFFVLSAVSSAVTFVAQKEAVQPLTHISLGIRVVNATVSYVRYLYKMFWPVNLALPYPHHGYWPLGVFGLSAALILAAVMFAIQFRRKFPFLITGWFWYLGMLVPAIGLVQVGTQSMADRYTYLPLIGVFILLAWGAGELFERWRLPALAGWSLALLVLAPCTARTLDQLRHWKNSETLFRHTVAVTKGNAVAYYSLGEYYLSQGRLDDAVADYLQAIQIKPNYDDALNNLGVTLARKGELIEAIARIRESISFRPDKADAFYNLGNVFIMQHKPDEAATAYTEALRLKPDYPEAHNNLANVLLMKGQREAAVQHYRETLRLHPGHEGAQRQLRALGEQTP